MLPFLEQNLQVCLLGTKMGKCLASTALASMEGNMALCPLLGAGIGEDSWDSWVDLKVTGFWHIANLAMSMRNCFKGMGFSWMDWQSLL